jgi:non-homologous end joining protein Ku
MASTIWKGQLAFGLVSFPVRLQKAARRERIALKYLKETNAGTVTQSDPVETGEDTQEQRKMLVAGTARDFAPYESQAEVIPVRQGYFSEGQRQSSSIADLQHGYEVAPDAFVVVRPEELKRLRKATSPDMQILRSV